METIFDVGVKWNTANTGNGNFMLTGANEGQYPDYTKRAHTQLLANDGSPRWTQLYERSRRDGPIQA